MKKGRPSILAREDGAFADGTAAFFPPVNEVHTLFLHVRPDGLSPVVVDHTSSLSFGHASLKIRGILRRYRHRELLPGLDSNQDTQIQSLRSYHYTTRQYILHPDPARAV